MKKHLPVFFGACLMAAIPISAHAKIVMLNVDIVLDQVAPGEMFTVGQHDKMRIVYDDTAVDPKTGIVKPINMQHFIMGKYTPAHADATMMPMNDAWLDLSAMPYRYHFRAAVTHGKPILIEADENTRRLTIRPGNDPHGVLISGIYTVDTSPITGPEALAAATPEPAQ